MDTSVLKRWLSCKDIKVPELYLVGGTVRDLFLEKSPKDLDLVCKGAKEFAGKLAQYNNAAFVPMEKKPDEPCYRVVERENSDNYLDIAEMRGKTIIDDLNQRDFTINAIAVEVKEDGTAGEVVDPLNGAGDIEKKTIKMASDKSIVSDPLRILRAVRLAAILDFTIEASTLKEMRDKAALLKNISAERIMTELLLILKTSRSSYFFRQMEDLGILRELFPEIIAMNDCAQDGFHHLNVWEHSMLVMENTEDIVNSPVHYFGDLGSAISDYLQVNDRLPLLKLTALLHDAAKPAAKGTHPDTGRITFYEHDKEGAKAVEQITGRLKMPGQHRDFMALLVAEHLHVLNIVSGDAKTQTVMRWFRKMGDDSVSAIILAMADVMSSKGPASTEEYRSSFIAYSKQRVKDYYEKIKARIERQDLVSGTDLIAIGMKPGPEIGRILSEIRSAQDTGSIKSREEALELARDLVQSGNDYF